MKYVYTCKCLLSLAFLQCSSMTLLNCPWQLTCPVAQFCLLPNCPALQAGITLHGQGKVEISIPYTIMSRIHYL